MFLLAYFGDSQARKGKKNFLSSPFIYTLSISVYCTSWTFYGAVGSAARNGLEFLAVYLGPTLIFVGWWFILRKLVDKIPSVDIPDFHHPSCMRIDKFIVQPRHRSRFGNDSITRMKKVERKFAVVAQVAMKIAQSFNLVIGCLKVIKRAKWDDNKRKLHIKPKSSHIATEYLGM